MRIPPIHKHLGTVVLTLVTLVASAIIVWYVVKPAYVHPSNHTYTSGLGYPAVLRMRGKPFPVTVANVTERTLKRQFLGEGLVESEPVRVPIVPEGRIARVYVKEGDYVTRGQLLAELDPRFQEIKIAQAKTAIDTAAVQLERAKVGSPYTMTAERPEIVAAQLESAKEQVAITSQLVKMYTKLQSARTVPIETLLQQQLAANQAMMALREAQENIKISQAGRPLSVQAAEFDLQETRLKHQLYSQQLEGFKIYAETDGLVAQVLVHEGEYNRNPGTSAFVLAVGKWFGGNFDQTTIARFGEGAAVNIRLEAFPGKLFEGRVRKVKPMVTYNPGGPEAARPVRPLGTGSPEWPATFTTRIEFVGDEKDLRDVVPGLTGFAEVKVERHGAAVPEGSVTSVSAGKGIAYVVDGDSFRAQPVVVGQEADGWVEVVSGLTPGMTVIADGYQILERGDRIATSPAQLPEPRHREHPEEIRPPQVQPPEERQDPSQEAHATPVLTPQRSPRGNT